MKRFIKLFSVAMLFTFASWAPRWGFASVPTQVTISTVVPNSSANGAAAFTSAAYPQLTGNVKLREIYISNDGAAEAVSLWTKCTSSTTAVAIWTGVIPASGNVNVDVLPDQANIANPCFHKGLNGSGTVKGTFIYQ